MTDTIPTLWHNPRCSKSRGTLELLQQRGITPHLRAYLDVPPSPDELRTLLDQLGLPARDLLRSGEALYTELGLGDPGLDDTALIAAMSAHPHLIERPVLVTGERAVICRPPERAVELL